MIQLKTIGDESYDAFRGNVCSLGQGCSEVPLLAGNTLLPFCPPVFEIASPVCRRGSVQEAASWQAQVPWNSSKRSASSQFFVVFCSYWHKNSKIRLSQSGDGDPGFNPAWLITVWHFPMNSCQRFASQLLIIGRMRPFSYLELRFSPPAPE